MSNKPTPFDKTSLKEAMKYFEEQQRRSTLLSRRILVSRNTYDQWVKSLPEGFKPDERVTPSPFIEDGKAYGVPDDWQRLRQFEVVINRETMQEISSYETQLMWGLLWFYGHSARPTRKPTTWTEDNPNWSIEWDDWRNREDYKQFRIYRFVVWLFRWLPRRKPPVEMAAPKQSYPINYHIPV